MLAGACQAQVTDTCGPGAGELRIPVLRSGTGTYGDVTLTVGSAATTRYNAIGSVARLGPIGRVQGADTFDGVHLHLLYVLVGSSRYYNVVLNVITAGCRCST